MTNDERMLERSNDEALPTVILRFSKGSLSGGTSFAREILRSTMNDTRSTLAAMLALALLSGAGCVKTQSTIAPPPPQPNPPPQVAAEPTVRIQTLGRLADDFAHSSTQLPGDGPSEHRKLMAAIFAQLQQILPLLQGPNPGAE